MLYAKEVELVERHFESEIPTTDEVINEIVTNKSYIPNLKEILNLYFEQNPKAKQEWINWLGGK
jgi:hypothetical protein